MIPSPSYDTRLADWAGQDLAALATTWDQARALLEPGRERRWHRPVLTEEQQQHRAEQHRADRHAADLATRAGIKTLPATAAPADLRVVEAMQQAGWAVEMLAAEIREHLGAGALDPGDVITAAPPATDPEPRGSEPGMCSVCGQPAARYATGGWSHLGPTCWQERQRYPRFVPRPGASGRDLDRLGTNKNTEADDRFYAARRWLATSGLHAVHGDLLEHAANEIRRALRLLTAVTDPQQYTRSLDAACPQCQRLSLRAHLDAVSTRDWWVQCHAADCRARWEWDQWGDLGADLGVDVYSAITPGAAA